MSLLSKLFGKGDAPAKGTQLDPEVRKIFEKIEHLLRDDDAQLDLVDPKLREVLRRAPYYDKSPNGIGPFGLCKTNPIPTNGPIGELAYLSRLVTNGGERLLFHRVGAVDNIDIFEAVTFSGGQWFILFLDMYHPKKSRLAPDGFRLSPKACQFSGFHHLCADFPYDFAEMKRREGLSPAYMPTGDILHGIDSRAYERPASHRARLEHLGEATQGPKGGEQAHGSDANAPRTMKDLVLAREPPWHRVSPVVINTIIESVTDKGLLEAFILQSMNVGLVPRYEVLGRENHDSKIIRARISEIMCETGNRAIPSLAKALEANQRDVATKQLALAGDTFEAAIAFSKNQIVAYVGLATIYGMLGKNSESRSYAKLGLSELEKMRREPTGQAIRESSVFPADSFEQLERMLLTFTEL